MGKTGLLMLVLLLVGVGLLFFVYSEKNKETHIIQTAAAEEYIESVFIKNNLTDPQKIQFILQICDVAVNVWPAQCKTELVNKLILNKEVKGD